MLSYSFQPLNHIILHSNFKHIPAYSQFVWYGCYLMHRSLACWPVWLQHSGSVCVYLFGVCLRREVNVLGAVRHFGESKYTSQRPESDKTRLSLTQYYSAALNTLWGTHTHTHQHTLSHQACLWVRLHRVKSSCPAHLRAHQVQCLGALCMFVSGQCFCSHGAHPAHICGCQWLLLF